MRNMRPLSGRYWTMTTKKALSQKPSAIKSREQTRLRREEKARLAAEAAEANKEPENLSSGSIGVETPEKPEEGGKEQFYHCANCDADITVGMKECPVCEMNLNWPASAPVEE